MLHCVGTFRSATSVDDIGVMTISADATCPDFPSDPNAKTAAVARTIFPTDNKHGRWESNLDFVDVASVPEPASLGLFGVALMCVAALRHRRRVAI